MKETKEFETEMSHMATINVGVSKNIPTPKILLAFIYISR